MANRMESSARKTSELLLPGPPPLQPPLAAELGGDGYLQLTAWENGGYDVTFASTTLRNGVYRFRSRRPMHIG